MRVAAVQMRSGINREDNLQAAEALIRQAAAAGATFISTPEMTTLLDQNRKRLTAAMAAAEPHEEEFFAQLSDELGVAIHIGSMPVGIEGSDKLRNRSLVFDQGRVLATYDKIHLFDADVPGERWKESNLYEHGEAAVMAELRGVRFGLSVCFDLRFSSLYRQLAKGGAQVLLVPAAFTVPTGKAHWEVLLRARAIETGSYVIAAAQGGAHEDERITYGHSMIINPWGEVIDQIEGDAPGLAFAEIDLERVADMRRRLPSLTLERAANLRLYGA